MCSTYIYVQKLYMLKRCYVSIWSLCHDSVSFESKFCFYLIWFGIGSESVVWFVIIFIIIIFLLQILADMKMLQEGVSIGCTQSKYSMV